MVDNTTFPLAVWLPTLLSFFIFPFPRQVMHLLTALLQINPNTSMELAYPNL